MFVSFVSLISFSESAQDETLILAEHIQFILGYCNFYSIWEACTNKYLYMYGRAAPQVLGRAMSN